jgi:tetratricopeptide (TPR) repeat protein
MVIKTIFKKQSISISLCAFILTLGFWSCVGSELDENVLKAYELRMNGKADEAKTLLEKIISDDSTNADAFYELARSKFQMGLANPRELSTSLDDIQKTTELARKNDPENVIYAFFAGRVAFFQAYIALQRDPVNAKEKVKKLSEIYEDVLKLKPDYHEAMLYLGEINSLLTADQGGDSTKAEYYAGQLEKTDKVFGAKARLLLLSDKTDAIDYWKKVLENNKDNASVLEELGKAYMSQGKIDDCQKCFEDAVKLDPKKNILFLDLARYHVMTAMRSEETKDKPLALAEQAVKKYQSFKPVTPLNAFSWEVLAKIKSGLGDKQGSTDSRNEANKLDPFYSRAFGVPTSDLFVKPGEVSYNHQYLFRPF